MYYRIAVQTYAPPALRWQSDLLCSLPTVVHWLMYFRVFPPEQLRVFSSDCRDALDEQLRRANAGLDSTSVPATHFVPMRASVPSAPTPVPPPSATADSGQPARALPLSYRPQHMTTPLELRRYALELGTGGDCDTPYRFTIPSSTPEVVAWVRLLARVRRGDLRAEIAILAGADGRS